MHHAVTQNGKLNNYRAPKMMFFGVLKISKSELSFSTFS